MAKFNVTDSRPAGQSYVTTKLDAPVGLNQLGGAAYARETRSELYLLAIALLDVDHDTWHEKGDQRLQRFRSLVHHLAVRDAEWLSGLLAYLRKDMNMRSASLVGAAEFVYARRHAGLHGLSRQVVSAVLRRADEPGELLAYWTSRYGRRIPKPLKRGIADRLPALYDQRSLLKYNSDARAWRFADVIEMTHPKPRLTPGDRRRIDRESEYRAEALSYESLLLARQSALWRYALDLRHGRPAQPPALLDVLNKHRALMAVPVDERRDWIVQAAAPGQIFADAGMTWEAVSGWVQGGWDAELWKAVLPSMPYMSRLRNLRNLDRAKVPDELAEQVAKELADPEKIRQAHQFPFRFLAAYRAVQDSLRWAWPLEKALNVSLERVPGLTGRTLVLVDRSPSMWYQQMSGRSQISWADGAALFGAALALRAEQADLVEFGEQSRRVELRSGESVLRLVERFGRYSGTNIPAAIRAHFRRGYHDRVVVVTDEQTRPGMLPFFDYDHGYGRKHVQIDDLVPDTVPLYLWNLGGYEDGAMQTGVTNRHTLGGLTDAAFKAIPMIERGMQADWPWMK